MTPSTRPSSLVRRESTSHANTNELAEGLNHLSLSSHSSHYLSSPSNNSLQEQPEHSILQRASSEYEFLLPEQSEKQYSTQKLSKSHDCDLVTSIQNLSISHNRLSAKRSTQSLRSPGSPLQNPSISNDCLSSKRSNQSLRSPGSPLQNPSISNDCLSSKRSNQSLRSPGSPLQNPSISNDCISSKISIQSLRSPGSPLLEIPKMPSRQSSAPACRIPSRSSSLGQGPNGRSASVTPTMHRKVSMTSLQTASSGTPGMATSRTPSRRASSAHLASPAPSTIVMPATIEEKPAVTASSYAKEYFAAELARLHAVTTKAEALWFDLNAELKADIHITAPTQLSVFLNDKCYGHRWSRPKIKKGDFNYKLERPERLQAISRGIASAYVALGGLHAQGARPPRIETYPSAVSSVPFRIHKTTRGLPLTSQAVTNVHGEKWMRELKAMCDSAESKLTKGEVEVQRLMGDYKAQEELHSGDLYLCSESLNAIEGALGAVCDAVDSVFGSGPRRAFVGVRPPGHHCSAVNPSGFCWVNNVCVGINHAALKHQITNAVIIDFDLHHGDGSQSIAYEQNLRSRVAREKAAAAREAVKKSASKKATKKAATTKELATTTSWEEASIAYLSLHDLDSYPCEEDDEGKNDHASVCRENYPHAAWNVHLQPWETEQEFWELYESSYIALIHKSRKFLRDEAKRLRKEEKEPKAAIFLSAGFDASEWETGAMQRHPVNVPTEFYVRLTQDVVRLAAEEGLGVDGRIISVLEGGYSDRALCSGVFSHLCGLAGDQRPGSAFSNWQENLAQPKMTLEDVDGKQIVQKTILEPYESMASTHPYDRSWWASTELAKLENFVNPPPNQEEQKKSKKLKKQRKSSTYASPTHASTARVSDSIKTRRSLSSLAAMSESMVARSPSPPSPEVSREVATYELSKLLIPSERQTDSYKWEDLKAKYTAARQAPATTQAATKAMAARPLSAPPLNIPLEVTLPEVSKLSIPPEYYTDGPKVEVLDAETSELLQATPASDVERPSSRKSTRLRKAKLVFEEESSQNRRKTVGSCAVSTAKVDGLSAITPPPELPPIPHPLPPIPSKPKIRLKLNPTRKGG